MRRISLLLITISAVAAVSCMPVIDSMAAGSSLTPNMTISDGITIGDLDMSGKTYDEAKSAIESKISKACEADITVYCVDNESAVLHMGDISLTWNNPDVVDEAVAYGNKGNVVKRYKDKKDIAREGVKLPISYGYSEAAIRQFVQEQCIIYNHEAVDATLERVDGGFNIVAGMEGAIVDEDEAISFIEDFITGTWSGNPCEIELPVKTDVPKGTEEDLSQVTDVLGTFSTSYKTSGADRSANVANGCRLVNGTTVYPGEEFSVYNHIKPFSEANGYHMAGSYVNGLVVDSLGGGICQVSTTLYNAVIRAELEIVERNNHSMVVSYVPVSQDAAISESSGKDFRFINNTDYPIYIEGYTTDEKKIVFNVYGKETRPSDRTVEFETKILETIVPDGEKIITQSDKPVGYSSVQSAHTGYKAQLIKIVKEGGTEVSREVFNTSTYNAVPRTAVIGTASADPVAIAQIQEAVGTGSIDYARSVAGAYAAQAAAAAAQVIGEQ